MIVGTPRSGTTLMQRTVTEASGLVTVPETHMLTVFAPRLQRQVRFPLAGGDLRALLEQYVALPQHRGGAPSVEALFQRLAGTAHSLVDVLVAVVTEQAPGTTGIVEKTPDHLLWVRHLAAELPEVRFVAVVRDPRAVCASIAGMHWGQRNVVKAAERWACDQRRLATAADVLGPERFAFVRYEDLVADVEAVEQRLRDFVGALPESGRSTVETTQVFRPHETTWKQLSARPPTRERVGAWAGSLSDDAIQSIEMVCADAMATFAHPPSMPAAKLDWRAARDRRAYHLRRRAHEWRIDHTYAKRAGLVGEVR